jgi:hypothetical protein
MVFYLSAWLLLANGEMEKSELLNQFNPDSPAGTECIYLQGENDRDVAL